MRRCMALYVPFLLAACDLSTAPETRSQTSQLEVRGMWTATIQGVGASPLSGTATVREYGSYSEVEVSIGGAAPAAGYQWRIFRGPCAATVAAELGLHLGVQSYPDIVANGTGTATLTRILGGSLNSPAGVYSLRLRPTVAATNWNGLSPVACGDLQRS
jgi:hypothetical protein